MKKIKEASHEYFRAAQLGFENPGSEAGFKAGVEFAQRWISVEDELPEKREREYQIIAKTDNIDSAMHGIIFTKWIKDESSLKSIKNYFTHWRPIELK